MNKIISVSGRPGLYEIQTQTRIGVIAKNLQDGKRIVTQPSDQVSVLSDIQIYTYAGEIALQAVLEIMHNKAAEELEVISPKASKDELKTYFSDILPDYDAERVYVSDIKKIIQWYKLLKDNKKLVFESKGTSKKTKGD
tara:strand:+ start:487 stop:903 length:417 start_codon:yes stop_codon:yes gene_type:complete